MIFRWSGKIYKIPRWTRGPGPPRDRQIQDFWFWTDFQEIKKIPFQGDHSKFEFLECCLKKADDPPGGGLRPPPWGILAFSRNREIRISSDRLGKRFFWFVGNLFKNRNLVFSGPSGGLSGKIWIWRPQREDLDLAARGTIITTTNVSGGRSRRGKSFLYYSALPLAGTKKRRPKT